MRTRSANRTERYIFKDLLGLGGHGRVFRAHDLEMGCDVAAKMLTAVEPEDVYRLKREFRLLAGVAHPNLVELHDLLIDGARCFFTMELIDGVDFLRHVRGSGTDPGPLDEAGLSRLRTALGQLVAGLAALHAAGRLHCDIKPGNVLVGRDGRVVLLDFGLVRSLRVDEGTDEHGFAGTADYVAPEQAWGQPVSIATDRYSVGAMLYEALTGHVPFEGPPARTFVTRTKSAPPSPNVRVGGIPPDLDALVVGLLNPDPARRPELDAILRCATAPPLETLPIGVESSFVGRIDLLARLHALAKEASTRPVLVEIRGPSGIGKTALLREFALRIEDEGAIVLRGRCHPQEAVPYQALDGALDSLTRTLAAFDAESAMKLVPDHAAALGRLFPVLRRLPEWNNAPDAGLSDLAAPELRRRAVAALRALLTRMANHGTLVLWLDDVQWGDSDSIALLSDVLRLPEAPPALVLLAYRSDDRRVHELLTPLRRGNGLAQIAAHQLDLGPLDVRDVEQLVVARFGDRKDLCAAHIDTILAEARGVPFFAGELAGWLASGRARSAVDLPHIIADRLDRLPADARQLLEVAAVAGRPLPRGIALAAAGIEALPSTNIPRLRMEQLLRDAASAHGAAIEPSHDRIREAVLAALSADELRARHRSLARALAARPDTDPDALFEHLLGAGERDAARDAALAAAVRAEETLAWGRAAHCLRQALELGADNGSEAWQLWKRLGVCLSGAGRAAEAAEAFRHSASVLMAREPWHAEIVALRRSAAEQHLRGGDMEAGVTLLRDVLTVSGVSWPKTAIGAVWTILGARMQLALEDRIARAPAAATPARIQQLDAHWSACLGLNMTDFLRSAAFQARHAVLARRTTDARHLTRAVSTDVAYRACEGGAANRKAAAHLEAKASKHAADAGDPESAAFVTLCAGVAGYYNGRFREALLHIDAVEPVFANLHDGITWEIGNCWMYRAWSLGWLGEMAELCRVLPEAVARARAQGNRLALAGLAGAHAGLAWLASDQPEEGRALADEAISPFPPGSFQSPHYAHALSVARIELYEGYAVRALERVEAAWPRLRANQMLRMQMFRVELTHLRASVALSAAAAESTDRERRLRIVEAAARQLAAEDHPCGPPVASVL